MNTGRIESWDGNITDIGPLYPFVGTEMLMVILCLVFWIGWHVLQIRMENRQLEDEARRLRQGDTLRKVLDAEHSPERM
ncbi:hypothetical protein [Dongia sp. agr-C8]